MTPFLFAKNLNLRVPFILDTLEIDFILGVQSCHRGTIMKISHLFTLSMVDSALSLGRLGEIIVVPIE